MALRSKAPLWAHIMVYAGAFTMVVSGTAAAVAQYGVNTLNSAVQQEDILSDFRAEVGPNIEGPLDFLVLGVDEQGGEKRTDTIIMVHVNADLTQASLISIPRDLWVPIPDCGWGYGGCETKINHAVALNNWQDGLANLNQTLLDLTGVRFHAAATANFEGFLDLVDIVGQIELCPWHDITSIHSKKLFPEGCAYYDKKDALDLVRQRYGWDWPSDWEEGRGGDYGRTQMQQQAIKSILVEAKKKGYHTDPGKAVELLNGFGDKLTVDRGSMQIPDLIVALRDIDPSNFTTINVPSTPEDYYQGGQKVSAVAIHEGEERMAADALWLAIQNDTLDQWILANPKWVNNS
jgi:polyisoprenyl-teichoic acid--peptidoglycan teichoic acid transferase